MASPLPTAWSCFGPRQNKSRVATATWRASCAVRHFRMSCRAAGICISRWWKRRPAATPLHLITLMRCPPSAVTTSAVFSPMRVPRRRSPRRPSTATNANGRTRSRQIARAFTATLGTGYKRYGPISLAPDRAIWARDNRGVMIRALGQPGEAATRLENRVGEPAANPYLYVASQIYSGLDGIARRLDPGPSADTPYETVAALLPKNLEEALTALRADHVFRTSFGTAFVDYYAHIKSAEMERFREGGGDHP